MLDIKQVIDLIKSSDIAGAKELVISDTDVQGSDAFKALVTMLAEATDTSDATLLEKAQTLASQVEAEFTHEDEGMARANTTLAYGGEEGSEHAHPSDEEGEEEDPTAAEKEGDDVVPGSTEAPKEDSEHAPDEEGEIAPNVPTSGDSPKEDSKHESDAEEAESGLGVSLPTGPSAFLSSVTPSRDTEEKSLAGDLPPVEDLSTAS